MSNILDFPGASTRNDAEIERGIREGLTGKGFSGEAVEAAIAIAMPLFKESKSVLGGNISFPITSALNEAQHKELESQLSAVFQKYQSDAAQLIQKLIVKIALLEAKASGV
ncbi:hypothetical protein [Alcanivorax sp. IL2]|uniref:hypothetical protein n=1 Tax=Alcanivorax sp. IL2 TaxID=3396310 RepID=UPI0039C180DC